MELYCNKIHMASFCHSISPFNFIFYISHIYLFTFWHSMPCDYSSTKINRAFCCYCESGKVVMFNKTRHSKNIRCSKVELEQ